MPIVNIFELIHSEATALAKVKPIKYAVHLLFLMGIRCAIKVYTNY